MAERTVYTQEEILEYHAHHEFFDKNKELRKIGIHREAYMLCYSLTLLRASVDEPDVLYSDIQRILYSRTPRTIKKYLWQLSSLGLIDIEHIGKDSVRYRMGDVYNNMECIRDPDRGPLDCPLCLGSNIGSNVGSTIGA